MLAFLARLVGLAFLAVAFALFVADATRIIASGRLVLTGTGDFARSILPATIDRLQQAASTLHPLLWDPLAATALLAPACLVLGALALVFLYMGAKGGPADD